MVKAMETQETYLNEAETAVNEALGDGWQQMGDMLRESISYLNLRIFGGEDWRLLGEISDPLFINLATIKQVAARGRMARLLSPIIRAGINALKLFTFAKGYKIRALDEKNDEVLQTFLNDPLNIKALFGIRAIMDAEADLNTDGNIFLWYHPQPDNVQIRRLDLFEISDIFCDPNDRSRPWFYLRSEGVKGEMVAYPDIMFYPPDAANQADGLVIDKEVAEVLLKKHNGQVKRVVWDKPIQHILVNKVNKWGISSLVASMIWAKVYEQFLGHRATLYAAYAVFATVIKKNAKQLANVRAALQRRQEGESPVKGATATITPDDSIESFNSRNATTPPSEGLQFLEMVMMDFGFPPNVFGKEEPGGMGESGRNKLTVLRIEAEQKGWSEDFAIMGQYVLLKAIERNQLNTGTIIQDGTMRRVQWNDGVNGNVVTVFPPVVEDDVAGMVDTIIKAVTLDGKQPIGHITPVQFMELIQQLLKLENDVIDTVRDRLGDDWPGDDGAFAEFANTLDEVVRVNGHNN